MTDKKRKVPKLRFPEFSGEWEEKKFSDVFVGLQNNTLSRSELNYDNGNVQNVHYGDILVKYGDYIDASKTELPYITDENKINNLKKSFLKDGDIIIADTAEDFTAGKCVEIQGTKNLSILAGLHTIACRPKEKYGEKFLGYYINSPSFHNQLIPLMQGIKVISINKSTLNDTKMIVPKSITEQSEIGDYFSKIDDLIFNQNKKLDNLTILKNLSSKKCSLKKVKKYQR